jgi:integrase
MIDKPRRTWDATTQEVNMPRRRMQAKGNLVQSGNWWRIRWWEDVRAADGSIQRVRRSQIVGPAAGPGRIGKKEAQRRAQEDVLQQVNSRVYVPSSVITLAQFIEQRFDPDVVWSMKHSGQLHYAYCFSKIIPALGDMKLRDLDAGTIGSWLRKLLRTDEYSIQTVVHMKNALSAVIEHAKQNGFFSGDNPARLVRLPAMTRMKKPALSFEQAQVVLANLTDPYRTMALMSMTTSLNIAELCGLRWRRVNLSNRTIIVDDDAIPPLSFAVRENYYRGKWGPVKTTKRNRIQPLAPGVVEALRELAGRGSWTGPDDPVFASRNGTPIDAHNANKRVLKRAGRAAGVPGLSWHSFRRTTATLTSILGMPTADRVALMGHSNEGMTTYYSDSDINRRREFVDELAVRLTTPVPEFTVPTKGVA